MKGMESVRKNKLKPLDIGADSVSPKTSRFGVKRGSATFVPDIREATQTQNS